MKEGEGGEECRKGRNKSGWYTAAEVAQHCYHSDCWLIVLSDVLDISPLLAASASESSAHYPAHLAQPLLVEAGGDISHWFDPTTHDVRTCIDPVTGLPTYDTAQQGRFIHIPPARSPRMDWDCSHEVPWWKDERYRIGKLSAKTRLVRIKNVLTGSEAPLEVPGEETIREILERYLSWNSHARSYTWKGITVGEAHHAFCDLDMDKTLAENGIPDEEDTFLSLGLAPDHHVPLIHIYYNDDLTPS